MATGNSKSALRLSTGFGVVLSMMATVNVVGFTQLGRVGDIQRQLVGTNWVNADATHTVAATTSTNAREAMELTIAPEEERFAEIAARIDANKQAVDAALTTLDRLLYMDEGKVLLEQIKQQRALHRSGRQCQPIVGRRQARGSDTVDAQHPFAGPHGAESSIRSLTALENGLAEANSVNGQQELEVAHRWMLALGTLALALGIGCAHWIHRSLVCPIERCER